MDQIEGVDSVNVYLSGGRRRDGVISLAVWADRDLTDRRWCFSQVFLITREYGEYFYSSHM